MQFLSLETHFPISNRGRVWATLMFMRPAPAVTWRKLASGRSGNHTPHGWFVAKGPGISPGPSNRTYDTADLMPTVFHWLRAPRPAHFAGQPIKELLGD